MIKNKKSWFIGIIIAVAILSLTFVMALSQSDFNEEAKQSSGDKYYPKIRSKVLQYMEKFEKGHPDAINAFSALYQAAIKPGALDVKTKELITLGIAVSKRCDECIAYHTHASLEAGATEDEIMEVLGVTLYMGGGPSLSYATHAIEALEQFKEIMEKEIGKHEGSNK
ncbi:MAG: carboxymuconolactone decarboxylase family protein [Thermodesulfobacteriota bacterium]